MDKVLRRFERLVFFGFLRIAKYRFLYAIARKRAMNREENQVAKLQARRLILLTFENLKGS
jgi:hypothetical protein